LIPIACLLAVTLPALAQSPTDYDLSRYVVAAGGGRVAGVGYALLSTAGQPVAGSAGGDGYTMGSGFLGGGELTVVYTTYLPLILRDF
jgi:hypothetical protein